MTSSHSAQVPAPAARYFGIATRPGRAEHPVIAEEFRPGAGWKRSPIRKRVSTAWLRKLRREGVTSVALTVGGRTADFTVAELLR